MQSRATALLHAAEVGSILVREITYEAGKHYPSHAHERTQITLILGGTMKETVRGREEFASALSVAVKPAGMEHVDRVGPTGASTLQVQMQPCALATDWRWLHGDRVAGPFLALVDSLRQGSTGLEHPLYDALACLAEQRAPLVGATPPRWLRAVREEIDDRYAESPRVGALAAGAGVHPVYLARQFRRFYGTTVVEHLKRRRLWAAAALIEQTSRPLTDIAQEAGYFDEAHFCREFKKTIGLTPSAFRRVLRPR